MSFGRPGLLVRGTVLVFFCAVLFRRRISGNARVILVRWGEFLVAWISCEFLEWSSLLVLISILEW